MLQLGGPKLLLYVDLFYLMTLFYFLFCFIPLPHYFHVSHPACPSSDTSVNPYCTKIKDDSNHTIDFWGRKGSLLMYTQNEELPDWNLYLPWSKKDFLKLPVETLLLLKETKCIMSQVFSQLLPQSNTDGTAEPRCSHHYLLPAHKITVAK